MSSHPGGITVGRNRGPLVSGQWIAGNRLTIGQQIEDLKAGNLYVNVHTNRNKGGEVRGQMQP